MNILMTGGTGFIGDGLRPCCWMTAIILKLLPVTLLPMKMQKVKI